MSAGICKHRADLELLSASFTADGAENRLKPNGTRRLSGCIRSAKYFAVSEITPISYSAL